MTKKTRVAVLFGGRSAEHDVSILSAANVVKAIDRTRFEVVPIAIDRSGKWRLIELDDGALPRQVPTSGPEIALIPGGRGRLVAISPTGTEADLPPVDVVFPVLHGPFGEDGSVQGYAEIADVAYVGCGILASAAAMDKDVAKRLLREAGIAVARSVTLRRGEAVIFGEVASELGVPFFVKPARQGSSVGVGKVRDSGSFDAALKEAFRYDDKVLAEEFVDAREIECAVLEGSDGRLTVSRPGEIITAERHGFYSYEAKYVDAHGAIVRAPADVPAEVGEAARAMAASGFRALGCEGMARVDFFLRPDMSLVLNEINTIPGFTDISMYAKALAADGMAYGALIEALLEHALKRHADRN
jgi:D-alanine-D-alanine ligase